jgi:transmembrane sensor
MSRHDRHHLPKETVRDAAAAWHVRLSSEETNEADWLQFEVWLAQSPENARAYDEVEALWAELDEVQLPAAAPAKIVPLRPGRRIFRPAWGAAIAASLAAAVALGLMMRDRAPTIVYATAKGEQREIALADGTRLRLNSGSRVSVRLGRHERRVELAQGEAAFDVAHNPARPFVVEVGDREIRDVGTAFDVLRQPGQVDVAVRRGIVEVTPRGGDGGVRLVQGQGVSHREGAAVPDVVRAVDPDAAFAWTEGRLVYRDAPLAQVAADLNRYLPTPIEVAPDAGELRLTAVLILDKEDSMIARLAAFLPVEPVRQPGVVKLELRHTTR